MLDRLGCLFGRHLRRVGSVRRSRTGYISECRYCGATIAKEVDGARWRKASKVQLKVDTEHHGKAD